MTEEVKENAKKLKFSMDSLDDKLENLYENIDG